MGENAVSDERMLAMVPPHPLIKHWISVLRNEQTPCAIFKSAMAELGRLLIYEASRDWLPTITAEIRSPVGPAAVEFVDPREPVVIIPILRAGLALAEHAPSVLPATITYHLGMRRDEETLQPSVYLNNGDTWKVQGLNTWQLECTYSSYEDRGHARAEIFID